MKFLTSIFLITTFLTSSKSSGNIFASLSLSFNRDRACDNKSTDETQTKLFAQLVTAVGHAFWEEKSCHSNKKIGCPFMFSQGQLYVNMNLIAAANCIDWEKNDSVVMLYDALCDKKKKSKKEREWTKFFNFVLKTFHTSEYTHCCVPGNGLEQRIAEDVGSQGLPLLVESIVNCKNCLGSRIFLRDNDNQMLLDLNLFEKMSYNAFTNAKFKTLDLNIHLFNDLSHQRCLGVDRQRKKLSISSEHNNLREVIDVWFTENEAFNKITQQIANKVLDSEKLSDKKKKGYLTSAKSIFALNNEKLKSAKTTFDWDGKKWRETNVYYRSLNLDKICTPGDEEVDTFLSAEILSGIPSFIKQNTPCDWLLKRAPLCYKSTTCAPLEEPLVLEKIAVIERRIFLEEKRTLYHAIVHRSTKAFLYQNGCSSTIPFYYEAVGKRGVLISVVVEKMLEKNLLQWDEDEGPNVRSAKNKLRDGIVEMLKMPQFIDLLSKTQEHSVKHAGNVRMAAEKQMENLRTFHSYYNKENDAVELSEGMVNEMAEHCNCWHKLLHEFVACFLGLGKGINENEIEKDIAYNPFKVIQGGNGLVVVTKMAKLLGSMKEKSLFELHHRLCHRQHINNCERFTEITGRIKEMAQFAVNPNYEGMCEADSHTKVPMWQTFMREVDRLLNLGGGRRRFVLPSNLAQEAYQRYFVERPANNSQMESLEESEEESASDEDDDREPTLGLSAKEEEEAYNILGLKKGCELSEFKRVYKNKILHLHADKTADTSKHAQFLLIKELYIYLTAMDNWKRKDGAGKQ